jgi:hypothetical protein
MRKGRVGKTKQLHKLLEMSSCVCVRVCLAVVIKRRGAERGSICGFSDTFDDTASFTTTANTATTLIQLVRYSKSNTTSQCRDNFCQVYYPTLVNVHVLQLRQLLEPSQGAR